MVDRTSVVLARRLALVSVLTVWLGSGGCGGSSAVPGTASCTVSQMVSSGGLMVSQRICEESSGLSAAQVQQLMQQCMLPGGGGGLGADAGISQGAMYEPGPCSHDGALGGCRFVQGAVTSTAWYYQMGSFTSADIQQLCTLAGAMFVAP